LVNAFREKPLEVALDNWGQIQQFLNLHVTKTFSEALGGIKKCIILEQGEKKKNVLERAREIKEEFFTGDQLK